MIFRLIKSTNVPNRKFIFKAKLPAHFLTLSWVIGIGRNIYGIINNLEWCATKHPITCIFATGEKVGRIFRDTPLIPQLD